jgi:hypothetical protein
MTDGPGSWTDIKRDAVALIRAVLNGDNEAATAITGNSESPGLLATATAICAIALAGPAPAWPDDPTEQYVHTSLEDVARIDAGLTRLLAALNKPGTENR